MHFIPSFSFITCLFFMFGFCFFSLHVINFNAFPSNAVFSVLFSLSLVYDRWRKSFSDCSFIHVFSLKIMIHFSSFCRSCTTCLIHLFHVCFFLCVLPNQIERSIFCWYIFLHEIRFGFFSFSISLLYLLSLTWE